MAILLFGQDNPAQPYLRHYPKDFSPVPTSGGGPLTVMRGAYSNRFNHEFRARLTGADITASKFRLWFGLRKNTSVYPTAAPFPDSYFQNYYTGDLQILEANRPTVNNQINTMVSVGTSKVWVQGTVAVQNVGSDTYIFRVDGWQHFVPIIEEETTNNLLDVAKTFFANQESTKFVFRIETFNNLNQKISDTDAGYLAQSTIEGNSSYLSGSYPIRWGYVGSLNSTERIVFLPNTLMASLNAFSRNGNSVTLKINQPFGRGTSSTDDRMQIMFCKRKSKYNLDISRNMNENISYEWVIINISNGYQLPYNSSGNLYLLSATNSYKVTLSNNDTLITVEFNLNGVSIDDYYMFVNYSNADGVAYTVDGRGGKQSIYVAYFPPNIPVPLAIDKYFKLNQPIEYSFERNIFDFDYNPSAFSPNVEMVASEVEAALGFPNFLERNKILNSQLKIDLEHKGYPIIQNASFTPNEWDKNNIKGYITGASGYLYEYKDSLISQLCGEFYIPFKDLQLTPAALDGYTAKESNVCFGAMAFRYEENGVLKYYYANYYTTTFQNAGYRPESQFAFLPSFKILFLLGEIFKNLGFVFEHDIIDERRLLVIGSNKLFNAEPSGILPNLAMKDYLPELKLAEFLEMCRKTFGCIFDFLPNKKIKMISYSNLLNLNVQSPSNWTEKIASDLQGRRVENQNYAFGFEKSQNDIIQKDNSDGLGNYVYAGSVILDNQLPSPTVELKESKSVFLVESENKYYYVGLNESAVYQWQLLADGHLRRGDNQNNVEGLYSKFAIPRTSKTLIFQINGLSITNQSGKIKIAFPQTLAAADLLATDLIQVITPESYANGYVTIFDYNTSNNHIVLTQNFVQNESGVTIEIKRNLNHFVSNFGFDLMFRKNRVLEAEQLNSFPKVEAPAWVGLYLGMTARSDGSLYPTLLSSNYSILGTKLANIALRFFGNDNLYDLAWSRLAGIEKEEYRCKIKLDLLDIVSGFPIYFRYKGSVLVFKKITYTVSSEKIGLAELEFYKLFYS